MVRVIVAPPGGQPSLVIALALNYLKYDATWDNPPASFTLADHRFDMGTFDKLRGMSGIHDSTDPDLSAFRDRGGKLIIWHAWSDPAIPAMSSIAYYHAVTEQTGGLEATQRFARMFLFPGVFHCRSGYGPDTFDLFTPMYDWVENGNAPQKVIASRKNGTETGRTRPADRRQLPLARRTIQV